MQDSTTPSGTHPALPEGDPPVDGKGIWGLDLWNGGAWFSDWFVQRMNWTGAERKRLDELRPHLPGGAWESLLTAIRNHLERQTPLDITLCARLADGRSEWWQVQGVAEHNAAGQPVYLSGSVRELGAEQPTDAGAAAP